MDPRDLVATLQPAYVEDSGESNMIELENIAGKPLREVQAKGVPAPRCVI